MRENLLICSLISLSLLLLSCNQTTRKNNTTNSETETEETLLLENESEPKSSLAPNTLYPIAYIKNEKLYFYDFDNQNAVEFVEEADTILHCPYADDGNFYYTVTLLSGEILPQLKLRRTITLRNISSEVSLIKYIFNIASFEEDLTNRI